MDEDELDRLIRELDPVRELDPADIDARMERIRKRVDRRRRPSRLPVVVGAAAITLLAVLFWPGRGNDTIVSTAPLEIGEAVLAEFEDVSPEDAAISFVSTVIVPSPASLRAEQVLTIAPGVVDVEVVTTDPALTVPVTVDVGDGVGPVQVVGVGLSRLRITPSGVQIDESSSPEAAVEVTIYQNDGEGGTVSVTVDIDDLVAGIAQPGARGSVILAVFMDAAGRPVEIVSGV